MLEQRVAVLEGDVSKIKTILERLEPKITEILLTGAKQVDLHKTQVDVAELKGRIMGLEGKIGGLEGRLRGAPHDLDDPLASSSPLGRIGSGIVFHNSQSSRQMTTFRTLDQVDVSGKRVLLRVDLNVPMENGRVSDATRIERVLPTIREIADKGGKVILLAHFGRPKGRDLKDRLAPVAPVWRSISDGR